MDGAVNRLSVFGALTMKRLFIVVAAAFALFIDRGLTAADGGGIPLSALAGKYSLVIQGSEAVCFNLNTGNLALCSDVGIVAGVRAFPVTVLQVGEATRDAEGNSCATVTLVSSDLPVDASPPEVTGGVHIVGKVVTYDPSTGTGDSSVASYSGGKCDGAIFDDTGATKTVTSKSHLAASEQGKRIDTLTTSLTALVPLNYVGDFSISATQRKQ